MSDAFEKNKKEALTFTVNAPCNFVQKWIYNNKLFHKKNKFLKALCFISAILHISSYEIAPALLFLPLFTVHIYRVFTVFCCNNGQTVLLTQSVGYGLYYILPVPMSSLAHPHFQTTWTHYSALPSG